MNIVRYIAILLILQVAKSHLSDSNLESIVNRLASNDPTFYELNLSEFVQIDNQIKQHIINNLKQNRFVGNVIWHDEFDSVVFRNQVEKILADNNFKYRRFPNDLVHALLNKHVYDIKMHREKGHIQFADKSFKSYETKLQDWKIKRIFNDLNKSGVYSVLYENEKTKQMVLTFKGTDNINDLLFADIEEIYKRKFGAYSFACLTITDEATKLAKKTGYELSMTGHSLGAFLAELSVYHTGSSDYKAITFESPGTLDILESLASNIENHRNKIDLTKLDVITYLHGINRINTINRHIGSVILIKTDSKSYCWNLFKMSEGHGIDDIIQEFDFQNNQLKFLNDSNKVVRLADWPRSKTNSISEFILENSQICDFKSYIESNALNQLKYRAHFGTYEFNGIDTDILNLETSIDSNLLKLFEMNLEEYDDRNDFIIGQLVELKSKYHIRKDDFTYREHSHWIVSNLNEQYTVDDIREIMRRLIKTNNSTVTILKDFKSNLSVQNCPNEYFGNLKSEIYVKPENDIFDKIDNILNVNNYVWIYGDSGCGKSTLATEYAYFKREKSPKRHVYFFNTDEDSMANLALIKRTFANNYITKNSENKIDLIKEMQSIIYSCREYFKVEFLFILDNVKQLELIKDIVDNLHDVKFILTTLDKNLSNDVKHGIEVKAFQVDQCLEYLNKSQILTFENRESWRKNLKYLHKSGKTPTPLMLEEVIAENKENTLSPHELITKLRDKNDHKYLKIEKEDKLAFEILKNLAFIDGNSISRNIIVETFNNKNETHKSIEYLLRKKILKQKQDYNFRTIYELHQCKQVTLLNMLNINFSQKESLPIKEIIKSKLENYQNLSSDELEEANRFAVKLVENNCATSKKDMNFLKNVQHINTKKLINFKNQEILEKRLLDIKKTIPDNDHEIADSLYNIGMSLFNQQKYEEVTTYLIESLDLKQETLPENHPDIALILNNIGEALNYQGKYEEAMKYFEESLNVRKKILPENHSDVKQSLNNIAKTLRNQEKYKETLNVKKQILKESYPYFEKTVNNITMSLEKMGRYEEASMYLRELLNIRRQMLPENHPDIATTLNSLGVSLFYVMKYQEALKYLMESLKIRRQILPQNHADIATTLNDIGDTLNSIGKSKEGMEYLFESLIIRQQILPENHPDIALTLKIVGESLLNQQRFEEALEYFERSLSIRKDENSFDVVLTHINVAITLLNQEKYFQGLEYLIEHFSILKKIITNEYPFFREILYFNHDLLDEQTFDETFKNYEELLNKRRLKLPKNHPDIALTLNNIGELLNNQGKYFEALKYFQESFNIRLSVLPENDPDIESTINNIGVSFFYLMKYDEALMFFKEALHIKKQILPENDRDIAASLINIGITLCSKGENYDAIDFFQQSINIFIEMITANNSLIYEYFNLNGLLENKNIFKESFKNYQELLSSRRKLLPKNDPDIATSLDNIGMSLIIEEQYEEALNYLMDSLNIQKQIKPENHPDIALTLNSIGLSLLSQLRYEEALEYFEESLLIRKQISLENSRDIAVSNLLIGLTFIFKGDQDKGIKYILESSDIFKILLFKKYPYFEQFYKNIENKIIESIYDNILNFL